MGVVIFSAAAACHLVAAEFRHHDVEDDHVEFRGRAASRPSLPSNAHTTVCDFAQTFAKQFRHALFVFDY